MRIPVMRRREAHWGPTTRGRVALVANPLWNPRRENEAVMRASGVATRKSATSARPSPAPMELPCIAATIGVPVSKSRTASR